MNRLLFLLATSVLADSFVVWAEPRLLVRLVAAAALVAVLLALAASEMVAQGILRRWSRGVRHELANRIQLVEGWLKLRRYEEATRALDHVEEFFRLWRHLDHLPAREALRWVERFSGWEESGGGIARRRRLSPESPWPRVAEHLARLGATPSLVALRRTFEETAAELEEGHDGEG